MVDLTIPVEPFLTHCMPSIWERGLTESAKMAHKSIQSNQSWNRIVSISGLSEIPNILFFWITRYLMVPQDEGLQNRKKQPYLKLRLTTNRADYDHLNLPCPKMTPSTVSAITDTGAQSSLMGLKVFLACGFSQASMLPVKRKMYAANNEGINILGATFVRLSGTDSHGSSLETAEMVYVSDSTDLFYLNRHAMEQLHIIGPDFPRIGAATQAAIDKEEITK